MERFFQLLENLGHRERELRSLAQVDEGWVLDVTTGSGYLVRNLLAKNLHVVCVDISGGALTKLRGELEGKGEATMHFLCADATRLPFSEDSFPLAMAWSALAHIPDWGELVEELWRVSREIKLLEPRGSYSTRAFRDFKLTHEAPPPGEVEEKCRRLGRTKLREGSFFYLLELSKPGEG